MTAKWDIDYDWRTDKCFNAPCCPECGEALVERHESKGHCIACGEECQLTSSMVNWFIAREEVKTEKEPCVFCKKGEMTTHYRRNRRTLEWETCFGECTNGCRFIV